MQLPESFIIRMQALLGEEYPAFEKSLQKEQSVSIRYNPLKIEFKPDAERVPWTSHGYYLKDRPSFTFDPLFHAGVYYVQEASSMFLEKALRQYVDKPVRYLDLCAAPGGKTTLAIAALPEGSLVIGNEIERKRSNILAENVTKWGAPATMVMNNRSEDYTALTHFFDVILTDVPCSGEGMFRKDPQAITEWSEANVTLCADRQKTILNNIWDALIPGGLLIYSTCTYNTEENEEMLTYICQELGAEVLPVSVDDEWGIHSGLKGDYPVYRFMPHTTRGEGLFLAVLRKQDDEAIYDRSRLVRDHQKRRQKKGGKGPSRELSFPNEVKNWLKNPEQFDFEVRGEKLVAWPKRYAEEMRMLAGMLHPLCGGILLATLKGKDYMPEHALALSVSLNRDAFVTAEVDRDAALSYLRREAITLPADLPKGFVLVTYQNHPLGWVKHLGNRSNNLYPQEWRIRSSYAPEEEWSALT
ncbi:MAG: methyltransferase RsmF C-terminal domain-like protein [Bacteroidales bacterium]